MNRKNNLFSLFAMFILVLAVVFFTYENDSKNNLTKAEIQWLKEQDSIIYAANENAPPLRFVDEIDNQ